MYFVPSLKKPEHFLMSVGEPMYEIVVEEIKVHKSVLDFDEDEKSVELL